MGILPINDVLSGLIIYPEFLTEKEELWLTEEFRQIQTLKAAGGRYAITRYGKSIYKNGIKGDIPPWGIYVADKIVSAGFSDEQAKHLTLNEYRKGSFIEPHIDSPESGEKISIVSLGSEAVMVFTFEKERIEVIIPPRSLVQLKDQARHLYKHQILPLSGLRYSLVFRE